MIRRAGGNWVSGFLTAAFLTAAETKRLQRIAHFNQVAGFSEEPVPVIMLWIKANSANCEHLGLIFLRHGGQKVNKQEQWSFFRSSHHRKAPRPTTKPTLKLGDVARISPTNIKTQTFNRKAVAGL